MGRVFPSGNICFLIVPVKKRGFSLMIRDAYNPNSLCSCLSTCSQKFVLKTLLRLLSLTKDYNYCIKQ